MSIYDRALGALAAFKKDGSVPDYKKDGPAHIELVTQLNDYAEELQSDMEHAQRQLDKVAEFEKALDEKIK